MTQNINSHQKGVFFYVNSQAATKDWGEKGKMDRKTALRKLFL